MALITDGFCTNCGRQIYAGDRFCMSCGAEVKPHLRETVTRKEDIKETDRMYCTYCGAELDADSVFCIMCGRKCV